MTKEELIRNLKYTMKKHENDRVNTFDTNISLMCKDVLNYLEQESYNDVISREQVLSGYVELIKDSVNEVLDKIRAEITEQSKMHMDGDLYIKTSYCMQIIDKYKAEGTEVGVEIVKTDETKENEIKYLNINVSDSEVERNPDVVRLHSDAGVLEYVACGRMNEQWKQLKETIIEIRDNNKFEHEDVTTLCQFLSNYMDVVEERK